jgi:hypothetical protein
MSKRDVRVLTRRDGEQASAHEHEQSDAQNEGTDGAQIGAVVRFPAGRWMPYDSSATSRPEPWTRASGIATRQYGPPSVLVRGRLTDGGTTASWSAKATLLSVTLNSTSRAARHALPVTSAG